MLIDISNKVLVVMYILSCLNIIRHTYYIVQTWVKSTEVNRIKYKISTQSLILLGLSLSYVISSFFIGITL